MKTLIFLLAVLALSFFTIARASEPPVGISKVTIRAETLIIQEEIQKDLAQPIPMAAIPTAVGPIVEEQTWAQVTKIQQMLEGIPSLRKDLF